MKTKIVLWGTNSEEAKILIALELKPEENKVAATVFPESVATEEFHEALIKEWREGKEVPFPEVYTQSERELTASEGILPEGVKVNKPDIVSRAQTEWHFIVLSSKLYQAYQSELEDLNEKISGLTAYDNKAWDELKQFWNKVREQMRDRNLFREHADQLKNKTNTLFDTLKKLRSSLDAEFEAAAKVNYDKFSNRLSEIEEQLKGKANLFSIFEDLKSIQGEFKKAKLTRDLRSEVWARIDKIFKEVKERRFGSGGQMEKLQRRQHGLTNAIKKMENSIRRDEDELSFQERKVNSAYTGQLESQLRQAKINMIQERIRSKNEKLSEMRSTFKDLEQKMTNLRAQIEKEAKERAAKLEAAKAKAAALAAKEAEQVAKMAAERKAEEEAKAKAAQEKAAAVETPTEEKATEEAEAPAAESQDNNTSETPAKEEDVQE